MDLPNERSSHIVPTPRGGGLAIAVVWFISISILHFSKSSFLPDEVRLESDLYYALMSGVLISIISFIDDIYTLKPLPRIIVQVVAASLGLYFVGGLRSIDLGFIIIQNTFILNSIAFVSILWFINLFNFIDGINGYLSGGSIVVTLGIFFLIGDSLPLILAISVLGFLIWNWGKAKIFMGDIGSTLIGFTIAILLINYNNTFQFSILKGLILTAVFWFDATFTLFKRFMNKEQLSQPHKKHAYQRIVQYGFSHQKTSLIMIGINLVLFLIVFIAQYYEKYILLFLIAAIVLLFSMYKLVDIKKPFKA
jgi:Fuc2NAc and GlcNAc transferase